MPLRKGGGYTPLPCGRFLEQVKGSAMDTKALKKQMGAAIAMVLVAAVALGSATFAWFVNNTKVTADKVSVTAKAANTLLISHDNENAWGTTAKFKAEEATEFVPVSTIDATSFYKDSKWATETGATQKGEYTAVEFTTADAAKDYFTDTFKIKSSQDCGLYLDDETEFTMENSGDADTLKSMRLALVVGNKTFFYQVDDGAIEAAGNSYNTTLVSLDADGVKKAISNTTAAAEIAADNLSSGSVISLAGGSVAAPVDNTTMVDATTADPTGAKKLCDLTANQEQEVKVYIWMEGCDYDCNTVVVKQITEQAVKCVLGFAAGKTA